MERADDIVTAFSDAGYPIDVSQRPDGKWEVTVTLYGTPTTLFAAATTREAAIEHASRTIFPAIIASVITNWLQRRKERGQLLTQGPSRLALGEVSPVTLRQTDAKEFGGFGYTLRFRREPDDSYSWGVFDERTGEGMSAGVAEDFDDAKLEALMKLLPPNIFERKTAD